VEIHDVAPDIVVEDDSISSIESEDPQFQHGIDEVMKRIRENPETLPEHPPAPVKVD